MSKLMIAALLGSAMLLTGCRTVWVHPDASAEKYHEDTVRCQFGISSGRAGAASRALRDRAGIPTTRGKKRLDTLHGSARLVYACGPPFQGFLG